MTLPPLQYSRGGLMTRPLRDTFVEDEEAGGEALAGEETVNKHEICDIFGRAVENGFSYFSLFILQPDYS